MIRRETVEATARIASSNVSKRQGLHRQRSRGTFSADRSENRFSGREQPQTMIGAVGNRERTSRIESSPLAAGTSIPTTITETQLPSLVARSPSSAETVDKTVKPFRARRRATDCRASSSASMYNTVGWADSVTLTRLRFRQSPEHNSAGIELPSDCCDARFVPSRRDCGSAASNRHKSVPTQSLMCNFLQLLVGGIGHDLSVLAQQSCGGRPRPAREVASQKYAQRVLLLLLFFGCSIV